MDLLITGRTMRIALAQINPTIGDFSGNTRKMLHNIGRALREKCDLVVFPELSLTGYPPRDLLDKPSFVTSSLPFWEEIKQASRDIGVIAGGVTNNEQGSGKSYHNSVLFFSDGQLLAVGHKRLLPFYDVFDEERYFEPGKESVSLDFKGERIGLTVCEDIWNVSDFLPHPFYHCDPVCELKAAEVGILINISASPYHEGKGAWVSNLLQAHAVRHHLQVLYVNQVSGNDELIFHGHSMVWDETGRLAARCTDFSEDFVIYDTVTRQGEIHDVSSDRASEIIGALTLGLRDYARKCGFKKAVLGLSGGVDSALTACIAALALGPENVMGVAMPGPFNSPDSLEDAEDLARRIGIDFKTVPLRDLFQQALTTLQPAFEGYPPDVTEENLQARLRGLILMAFSNKFNSLLLSTGNKSEMAVGYCTLYGDMNGGLAVLGDVPKTLVYELAFKLNAQYAWIPERTLTRAPSAELRPDQTDQDTLPPYDVLDAILVAYVEKRLPFKDIVSLGWDPELVRWIISRVDRNEYKRWQAPPIIRVTTKAFGIGRRNPIAHGYREEFTE
jgi:NAD+ synthetase